jgi:hypothetical protein
MVFDSQEHKQAILELLEQEQVSGPLYQAVKTAKVQAPWVPEHTSHNVPCKPA